MLRIKWLLPLLLVLAPSAGAVTPVPYWTNQCAVPRDNANTVSTLSCTLTNVVAGRTIIANGAGSATSITVSSPTEALTCPAAAVGGNGTTSAFTKACYVVLASSHSTFTVTVTSSGGFNRVYFASAREYVGLGAFDVGCGGTLSTSCSLTTANAGEWLDVLGTDTLTELVPQTGFFQQQYGTTSAIVNNSDQKSANFYKITGGAGSQTAQWTCVGACAASSTAALAFQVSSPPALPSVVLVQTCSFAYPNTTRSSAVCPLHNYTANNMVVWTWASHVETRPLGTCFGPNCICPDNSSAFHLYNPPNTTYGTGVCVGFDTVNIATTAWGTQVHFGSGQSVIEEQVMELSGVNTSIDVGSEANANALTVNYTTIQNNEYTVTACFDNNANPLLATSPAAQVGNTNDLDLSLIQTQMTSTGQVTALAGSGHTTACSMTGSSVPLIGTLSFGIIASATPARRKQAQIF